MSQRNPKAPRAPRTPLTLESDDLLSYDGVLWRIHRTTGPHLMPWRTLRTYGPIASMRFDPHPGPLPAQSTVGVLYAACDVATALAEVYQATRTIDATLGTPTLTAWYPTRPLKLLNLTETWLVRHHASYALLHGPRAVCRTWARAIHLAWPHLDGLYASSTMTGRPNVVLWNGAADSFPADPEFTRPLEHPRIRPIVRAAARTVGYDWTL
ncbi:RES family NAD+ phosphorylase [Rhodococcus sp. HNM0569]|uniref:RES domain-containing protein n=1 Tax=Rhodococcus sp. HNM0569 TaxID=2716340 RepID=UPI00146B1B97|nr:RES family NAD+ phosphorylase [Rhodococcus sp. HNM0569]